MAFQYFMRHLLVPRECFKVASGKAFSEFTINSLPGRSKSAVACITFERDVFGRTIAARPSLVVSGATSMFLNGLSVLSHVL